MGVELIRIEKENNNETIQILLDKYLTLCNDGFQNEMKNIIFGFLIIVDNIIVGRLTFNELVIGTEMRLYILPEYQKLGYGTIATTKATDYAFNLGINPLVSIFMSDNEAPSYKILNKLGWVFDEELSDNANSVYFKHNYIKSLKKT